MSYDVSLKEKHTRAIYELSRELDSQNVKDIQFWLSHGYEFGSRDVDGKDALDLIKLLMKSGKIGPEGNSFLEKLLVNVNRKDLATKYFGSGMLLLEPYAQFPLPQMLSPENAYEITYQYAAPVGSVDDRLATAPSFPGYTIAASRSTFDDQSSVCHSNYQNLVSSVGTALIDPTSSTAVPSSVINVNPVARQEEQPLHRIASLKNVDVELAGEDQTRPEHKNFHRIVPFNIDTRVAEEDPTQPCQEELSHRMAPFDINVGLAGDQADPNDTRAKRIVEVESMAESEPEESMASCSIGSQSIETETSCSSSSVQSDGPTSSKNVDSSKSETNVVTVEADGVHGGEEIGRRMAELTAHRDQSQTSESALDRIMSAAKIMDFQVFESLPTKAGTEQIDHDKILAQLGMSCEIRGYQRSLAEAGLKGENNIVVLQTGGGKTHIAAYIAKYHQEKALVQDKKYLAVFIVPIRHLAEQQGNVFEDIEEPDQEVFASLNIGVAKNTDEFMDHVQKKQVIFCTAQILINVLRDKNLPINLKHFSQVIIDECHRTTGRHPNNRVMEQYFRAKLEEDLHLEVPEDLYKPSVFNDLPQIIGLTASLGAGTAKSDDRKSLAKAAYEHLSFLCANIDALKVVFPFTEEDKASLARHCPDPASEELIPVQRRLDQNFYKILRVFVEEMVKDLSKVDLKGVQFGQSEAFHYFKSLIPADGKVDEELHIAVNYLMEFNKAFEKLSILRCADVLHFLETNEDLPFYSPDFEIRSDFVRRTKDLWDQCAEQLKEKAEAVDRNPLPIMKKLKEKLMMMFENSSSRGILLARERFSTTALIRFIEDDVDLKKVTRPTRLVGQEEMTDKEVDTSLAKFRSGECNLLVATDIAQEGIDISECNFVIRYSFVSNAIGTIQAIGRARMAGSQCFLLVLKGSPEEEQEQKVRAKVQAMNDALTLYIKKDSVGEWEDRINKFQKKVYDSKKAKRKERIRALDAASKYDIVCGKCQTLITPADELVKILETNHHLVKGGYSDALLRKDLADKAEYNDHGDEVDRLNGIYCARCNTHKLGVEFAFRRGFYFTGPQVTIKAEQVKYKERSKGLLLPRGKFKWKDAPFKVQTESKHFEMDPEFSSDDEFEF